MFGLTNQYISHQILFPNYCSRYFLYTKLSPYATSFQNHAYLISNHRRQLCTRNHRFVSPSSFYFGQSSFQRDNSCLHIYSYESLLFPHFVVLNLQVPFPYRNHKSKRNCISERNKAELLLISSTSEFVSKKNIREEVELDFDDKGRLAKSQHRVAGK